MAMCGCRVEFKRTHPENAHLTDCFLLHCPRHSEAHVAELEFAVKTNGDGMMFMEKIKNQLADEVEALKIRLAWAERVVEAAKEWREAHEWAKQNPIKMLTSKMSTEEAGVVMQKYFDKEVALNDALATEPGVTDG